ncbi:hypothetical protein W5O_02479, partial [Candida albicans Ca6]
FFSAIFFFCHLFLLTCLRLTDHPRVSHRHPDFQSYHNQSSPKQSNNLPNKLHNRVATLIAVSTCLAVSKFTFSILNSKIDFPYSFQ